MKTDQQSLQTGLPSAEGVARPEPAIEARQAGKRFGADWVVRGLDFVVERGSIFGLFGPSGAGKTTTLRILTTLVRPRSGHASVCGFDVIRQALDVRRNIVVVIQEQAAELFLSVRENLLTFERVHGTTGAGVRRRAETALNDLGLLPEANRKVQDLSGGFRRRVQVAKVFMVDTPVVFLDEFSTGMDPLLKRSIMARLRRESSRGRTIVLTTQILGEAEELCDDILIINKGRQVARGDLHTLKLLSQGVYEVTLTYDRLPDGLLAELEARTPLRLHATGNTVELALRESETQVLDLVGDLLRRGRVLRVEVGGASLEDIFVDLVQREDA